MIQHRSKLIGPYHIKVIMKKKKNPLCQDTDYSISPLKSEEQHIYKIYTKDNPEKTATLFPVVKNQSCVSEAYKNLSFYLVKWSFQWI